MGKAILDSIREDIIRYLYEELDRHYDVMRTSDDLCSIFESSVFIHLPEEENFYSDFLMTNPQEKNFQNYADPQDILADFLLRDCLDGYEKWKKIPKRVFIDLSSGYTKIMRVKSEVS